MRMVCITQIFPLIFSHLRSKRDIMKTARSALFLALLTVGSAAAQEKVLNLYSARHYQTDEALYSDFTRQTGIKVNRIEGKEDELLERIRNEGANSPADVFITVDAARLSQPYPLPLFPPGGPPPASRRPTRSACSRR